ncbi:MAG: polyphenol oxidase family protein, partial [Pseudomonadota bacterium]
MQPPNTGTMAIKAHSLRLPGVRHGFFTREGGVSQGIYASLNAGRGSSDAPDAVRENRSRIAASMGVVPDGLISMNQTHSADVLYVDAPTDGRPRVDALVADRPGLALGVLHADCAPVLFCDPHAGVIAGAHAGWRGAVGGVLEATLAVMAARGADRGRTLVAIGPTIGPASYEVGPEFAAPIVADLPESERFFAPSPQAGHHLFDLPGYVMLRLERAGVNNVENLALDTYPDETRF